MSKRPWKRFNVNENLQELRDGIPPSSYFKTESDIPHGPAKGYIDETGAVTYVNWEREREKNGKKSRSQISET